MPVLTARDSHPVADIFPRMTPDEFSELVDDIGRNGLREAIWLHEDGRIIDGRNRYAACMEAGAEPHFTTWAGDGSLVEFVLSLNLHRRHLSSSQKAVVALDVLPHLEAEAKERQKDHGGTAPGKKSLSQKVDGVNGGRSDAQAAKLVGTNRQYVADAKKLAAEAPEKLEAVRSGQKTISEVKREIKNEIKEEKRKAKAESHAANPHAKARFDAVADLRVGCLSTVDVEAGSLDWIITDPPYPKEFLHTYDKLGEFAAHTLKPGGSLICMVGQSYLPDVMSRLGASLRWQWCMTYMTPGGQSSQLWARKVNTFWKPLLWYVNGDYDGEWFGDVFKSKPNDNDKQHHHWGQSESGMADIVTKITKRDQLICDPFCGGGTTGAVALATGRRFLGIDIDKAHIAITRARLQEVIDASE